MKPEGTKALHFTMSECKSFGFGVSGSVRAQLVFPFVISPLWWFFSSFEIEDGTLNFQK